LPDGGRGQAANAQSPGRVSAAGGAVLAIVKFGQKSWKPWLLSLAVELASRGLARLSTAATTKVGARDGGRREWSSSPADRSGGRYGLPLPWNQADQDENQRRELLLAYYLLRSPMYQAVTKYGHCPTLAPRPAMANAVGRRHQRPACRSMLPQDGLERGGGCAAAHPADFDGGRYVRGLQHGGPWPTRPH